ncbi:hypothetical protein BU26DRAFT_557543 [Trematosphaeria pertusa]|uniref:Uncharacterized protein n=1 Tax=Trematosphaeria pertusa TaxID=390896 RepID=A0A6A6J0N1_9PLEO|nr:uncharacterized protein BU26DRAFT_557543 [Trematosphaeria pertusa]KAF2256068.1 hypothetical protein BU26DRAFT_557543 [Trematosphaeria pertusa]
MCKILAHTEAINTLFETFFAAAAELAVALGTVFHCLMTDTRAYARLVGELRGTAGFRRPL